MMTGTFDLGRVTGFSAYEVWKAQPGNENKTEQDFLKFISSGGDWIDFDTTPIDLKTVRDYKTYGSVNNLMMHDDNIQDDGFREMIEIINSHYSDNDPTFSFESVSTPNNVLTGPDSPIYDVIQTLSAFTDTGSFKFVRYAQFNDSSKEMFITHAWECWEENGAAHKLADLFSITIGDVTKKTDGTNDVEFTKEELELGNDWIDFDTTPINFDSVRTYRTYGSTANLNADLTRGSVPGDALSGEFFSGTFMFESHSCRNNLKKSTEYDTIQIMILFSGSANPDEFAKYVRYGIFDEDDQTFTVQANWTRSDLFIDNKHIVNMASKLAKTFNLKIAGVAKPVDGSQNVEFTKEELGIPSGYYFKRIFSGFAQSAEINDLDNDYMEGSIYLVQLCPRVRDIITGEYSDEVYKAENGRYLVPSFSKLYQNDSVEDYSMCVLISSSPLNNVHPTHNNYGPSRYFIEVNSSYSYKINKTVHTERLFDKEHMPWQPYGQDVGGNMGDSFSINLTINGYTGKTLFKVENILSKWTSIGDISTIPYITNIYKLI